MSEHVMESQDQASNDYPKVQIDQFWRITEEHSQAEMH